ncbi:hypothetical protein CYQ88_10025 [Hydrogenovibrio sp. SC-1]|uniref:hypothetical protein n=1 Tax=Hydrogenovibrio sp. SC-1 TaxID=2065820 RepID=UPI000C79FA69|nr:hypothetical protein [Hydrogenovibrio sp. SC-1]PLA73651.1 hypothetical protein CYQ88_10025 [Hydrogenovibrio sp. SC-1]
METLQQKFDCLVEERFETIAGAYYLEQNPPVRNLGQRYNAKRSLVGKIAILHTILRFKYITPSNAQLLLCHKNKSTTSTFLKRMMNEKLIRRVKTKWPENPFVYAFNYEKAKRFLEEKAKIYFDDNLNDGRFDSSRYTLTESVRHLEMVQQFAISHSKDGNEFLTEYELKKLTTGRIWNMKFCDLVVKVPDANRKDNLMDWRGIEIETSIKSEKKLLHGIGRANKLLATNCLSSIHWYVDSNYSYHFQKILSEGNEIPNITYPKVASGGFSRKLQEIGTTTIVYGHHVKIYPDKYLNNGIEESDIEVHEDELWNVYR